MDYGLPCTINISKRLLVYHILPSSQLIFFNEYDLAPSPEKTHVKTANSPTKKSKKSDSRSKTGWRFEPSEAMGRHLRLTVGLSHY
jgi:hypothetical protein